MANCLLRDFCVRKALWIIGGLTVYIIMYVNVLAKSYKSKSMYTMVFDELIIYILIEVFFVSDCHANIITM